MRRPEKPLVCWLPWLVALTALAGCGESQPAADPIRRSAAPSQNRAPDVTFPRTATDSLQREVTLRQLPQRIVSLAPKNTEVLFAIGAGDQVVGVTSYCNYPAEARRREQVGGFSSKSLSLEKIVSLRPDLVVSAGEIHRPVIEELDRLEIPVLALAAESFDGLYQEMETLAGLTGHEASAAHLIAEIRGRVRRVRQKSQTIARQDRVTVFYQAWDEPLSAAGPTSFVGQMIELCGGVNVVADSQERYPQISQEVLLDRDPDVIIAPTAASGPMTVESLRGRPGWSGLKAVRTGRIHLIDGDMVSRCGPRLVEALEQMAHALYPKRFAMPAQLKPAPLKPAPLKPTLPEKTESPSEEPVP